jgi:uncharacterized membrane protein
LLGATIWVGSQVMMFAVVVPSLRAASATGARLQVLTAVTRRFGYLGGASLVLLVLTGIDNISRYAPASMFDLRYGYILAVKVAMVALVVALTLLHTLYVGPRLLALLSADEAGSSDAARARLRATRRLSVSISVLTLLLSLAILFCAALLRSVYANTVA